MEHKIIMIMNIYRLIDAYKALALIPLCRQSGTFLEKRKKHKNQILHRLKSIFKF